MARSVLVTGSVGFIGSHVVVVLLDHGRHLTVLGNSINLIDPANRRQNIAPRLEYGCFWQAELECFSPGGQSKRQSGRPFRTGVSSG